MNDREIMENILLTTKGVCDLYLHGAVESATAPVHEAFTCALNDALSMQSCIYQEMSERGWYSKQQAQEQSIRQVHQKYAAQA